MGVSGGRPVVGGPLRGVSADTPGPGVTYPVRREVGQDFSPLHPSPSHLVNCPTYPTGLEWSAEVRAMQGRDVEGWGEVSTGVWDRKEEE